MANEQRRRRRRRHDNDDVNDEQGQHTDEMLASFVRKLGQLSLALLRESTEKQVCGGVNKVLVFWWDARTFGGRRTEQTWAMDRRAAVDGPDPCSADVTVSRRTPTTDHQHFGSVPHRS